MAEFVLTFLPYVQSPTYDVLVMASEIDIPPGAQEALLNGKTVSVRLFVDADTELRKITIEKMRGHLKIIMPPDWHQFSSVKALTDSSIYPKVLIVSHDQKLEQLGGYITTDEFKLGFVK